MTWGETRIFERLRMSPRAKWIFFFSVALWTFRYTVHFSFIATRGFNPKFVHETTIAAFGVIVVTGIFWWGLRFFRNVPIILMFLLSAPLAFMADSLHSIIVFSMLEEDLVAYVKELGWQSSVYQTYMGALYFWAWLLGYLAITQYFKFLKEFVAVKDAQSQTQNAQLQMLRYQIDPHFLFNSLNSISSLILDEKNRRAEQMINGLSEFLRSSLDQNDAVKITLQEEINIAKKYLLVEGIRFEDKLSTIFNIAPETLNCLVPSLILQPAIENALKHAISPKKVDGKITISTSCQDGKLNLSVIDNGPGLTGVGLENGIGLANTRSRLNVLYGQKALMRLSNHIEGGAKFSLQLPVERAALRGSAV